VRRPSWNSPTNWPPEGPFLAPAASVAGAFFCVHGGGEGWGFSSKRSILADGEAALKDARFPQFAVQIGSPTPRFAARIRVPDSRSAARP
jgi:hypothetical protein